MDTNITERSVTLDEYTKNLADGFLHENERPLVEIKQLLNDLTKKQIKLTQTLEARNDDITRAKNNDKLKSMMDQLKQCREKLIRVRRDMIETSVLCGKLKKQAQTLEAEKEKDYEARRERLIKEQQLIGKF